MEQAWLNGNWARIAKPFGKDSTKWKAVSRVWMRLVVDPPYHSKYNPIERCWGILENHWNGDVLDSVETVVTFAQTGIPLKFRTQA